MQYETQRQFNKFVFKIQTVVVYLVVDICSFTFLIKTCKGYVLMSVSATGNIIQS